MFGRKARAVQTTKSLHIAVMTHHDHDPGRDRYSNGGDWQNPQPCLSPPRAMTISCREFLSVSRLPTGERAHQAFHGGTSATSSRVQTVICLERSLHPLLAPVEYLSYGTGTRTGELWRWRNHSPSPFDQRTDSPRLSLCMHLVTALSLQPR